MVLQGHRCRSRGARRRPRLPSFALDGGEEPELAGYYLIGEDGTPFRIGFSVANEFSDHVTEKINYLYLAHSKLRPAAFGPELMVGALPDHVEGTSRILRDGKTVGKSPSSPGKPTCPHDRKPRIPSFQVCAVPPTGRPACAYGRNRHALLRGRFRDEGGDIFEIEAPQFGLPLRNRLVRAAEQPVTVNML